MLVDVVEKLVGSLAATPETQVRAQSLLALAELVDGDDASSGVRPQLHAQLLRELEGLVAAAVPEEPPRLGPLRGEQARVVALALGFPDPEAMDLEAFDSIDALELKRQRRLAGLPEQPGLQAVVDDAIARHRPPDGSKWAMVNPDDESEPHDG